MNIRLNQEIISELQKHYKDDEKRTSALISKAVNEAYLLCHAPDSKRKISPDQILKSVRCMKLPSTSECGYRADNDILQQMQKYYGAKGKTETIKCCIFDVLQNKVGTKLDSTESVCPMAGQKNPAMLEFLKGIIDDIIDKSKPDVYAEPFCGTANVYLHMDIPEDISCHLSDISTDLINLLHVLRDKPMKLKQEVSKLKVDKDSFKAYKTKWEKGKESLRLKQSASRVNNIEQASLSFYLRNLSYYGKCGNLIIGKTEHSLEEKLKLINPLSLKLKDVTIRKRDALYILKHPEQLKPLEQRESKPRQKIFWYVDSPYIGSEKYYSTNTDKEKIFREHEELGEVLLNLCKDGDSILVSYRITASESMTLTSENIKETLDSLYLNKNLYIKCKKLPKEQVEIVISNVNFKGSKPYATSLNKININNYL